MNFLERLQRLGKWIGGLYLLGVLLWVVMSQWIVPPLIESAHHDQSHSILSSILHDQLNKPLTYYQNRWELIKYQGMMAWLGIGLMGSFFFITLKMIHQPSVFNRVAGEATPGSIGAIRMLTCAILLSNVIWEDLASTVHLRDQLRHSMGVFQFFFYIPFFESFLASERALKIFEYATGIILFFGVVGWKTRWVIPLGAFCYLILGGILRHYLYFIHILITPLTLMIVLSFLPCGDGFSLDRFFKVYKGQPVVPPNRSALAYTWSRYICWGTIALTYLGAGLSKLYSGGPLWWEGKNIRWIFYHDTLEPPTGFDWGLYWVLDLLPDFMYGVSGLAALLGELFYPLVLFVPTARIIFPGLMGLMHLSIFFFQNILFFDLILLQLVFFDFSAFRRMIGRWMVSAWEKVHILYDGECPSCRRAIRILEFFDVLEQLDSKDFRRLNLERFNQEYEIDLTIAELDKEIFVLQQPMAYPRFYAYQIIGRRLPIFWPLMPIFFLPNLFQLDVAIYRYVAKRRAKIISREVKYSENIQPTSQMNSGLINTDRKILRYPILLGILVYTLVVIWFFKIEYYPLTAYPMYSTVPHRDLSHITYIKAFSKHQDGTMNRTTFGEAIGAMTTGGYNVIVSNCFKPKKIDVCKKFLRASGSQYNRKVRGSNKILSYVIQRWTWNIHSDPYDPNHGRIVKEFTFNVL